MLFSAIARTQALRPKRLGMLLFLGIALATMLVLAPTGYGRGDGGEARIAFFGYSFANTFTQAEIAAAKQEAKKLGASVQFFDGKFDGAAQVGQIQDAIASGQYDGFIINANDGNAVVAPIKQAIAKGIKVICLYEPCGPNPYTLKPQIPGLTVQMALSAFEEGKLLADMFIKGCATLAGASQTCEIAFIPGSTTLPIDAQKVRSVRQRIKAHPKIKLVAIQPGGFLREEAYRVAKNILQAHPRLAVLGTGGDQMTLGAELAVKEAGLLRKVGLIAAGGAAIESIPRIRDGRWIGATVWVPAAGGRKAVELMVTALRGGQVRSSFNIRTLSPIGPVATKETVGTFKGDWHA